VSLSHHQSHYPAWTPIAADLQYNMQCIHEALSDGRISVGKAEELRHLVTTGTADCTRIRPLTGQARRTAKWRLRSRAQEIGILGVSVPVDE
jgi:hypothetical protein